MSPSEQHGVPAPPPEGGGSHTPSPNRSDEGASSELEERVQREGELRLREQEEREGPSAAPDRSGTVVFTQPSGGELVIPAPWVDQPCWLREYGHTTVLVIDSQISSIEEFNTKRMNAELLKTRICQPLNVEFVFCPECKRGEPSSRGQTWFPAAEGLLRQHADSVAAVCLGVNPEGTEDPSTWSATQFLPRIQQSIPGLPVFILTQFVRQGPLHEALVRSGSFQGFMQEGEDPVNGLCRFLCCHGWIADPRYAAFSKLMREQCSKLRCYAIDKLTARSGMPEPFLFEGESGFGKTWMAEQFAQWLRQVSPAVRGPYERVALSDFSTRDQNARVQLFGQGLATEAQKPTKVSRRQVNKAPPANPVQSRDQKLQALIDHHFIKGYTLKAHGGTLVLDEMGNAHGDVRDMLLEFADKGIARPEFPIPGAEELELDVLCLFTAQPAHRQGGTIREEMNRRCSRGGHLTLMPLAMRLKDVLPIFYSSWKKKWDRHLAWQEPDAITQWLLPEAQQWLEHQVQEHQLRTDELVDLVPDDDMIGIPSLEKRLAELLRKRLPSTILPTTSRAAPVPVPASLTRTGTTDGLALIRQLLDTAPIAFPRDRNQLRGGLDDVKRAAARLLLEYLEACAYVAMGADESANMNGTYRLLTGLDSCPETNTVRTFLAELFKFSPAESINALLRSPVLESLARQVGSKRVKEMGPLLDQVAQTKCAQTAPGD